MRAAVVHKTPPMYPWACMRCMAGESARPDGFIDMGIDLDYEHTGGETYGSIYICFPCMGDIVGRLENFYTKEEIQHVIEDSNEVRAQLRKVDAHNAKLDKLVDLGIDVVGLLNYIDSLEETVEAYGRNAESGEGSPEVSDGPADSEGLLSSAVDVGNVEPPVLIAKTNPLITLS